MNHRRSEMSRCIRLCSPLLVGLFLGVVDARPAAAAGAVIKVSCIGEQTTHSDLFPSRTNQPVGMQEYPAMLQTILGAGYNVMNYGDCCASVISGYASSETHPYISGNQFGPSQSFMPDIVIIGSWGRHDWGLSAKTALPAFMAGDTATAFTKFQTDYDTLVSKYVAMANKPKIFCSTPIPIPFGNDGPDDGYKTSPAADAIKAVCAKYSLPIVDLFTIFTGHKEYYINPPLKDSDGEHSSPQGAMVIAQAVADAILGVDGGVLVGGGSGGGGSSSGSGSGGGPNGGSSSSGSPGGSSSGAVTTAGGSSGAPAGGSSSGSAGGNGGGVAGAGSSGAAGGGVGAGNGGAGAGAGAGNGGASAGNGGAGAGVATGSSSGMDLGSSSGAGSSGAVDTSSSSGAGAGAAPDTAGTGTEAGKSGGCAVGPGSDSLVPWSAAGSLALGGTLLLRRRNRRAVKKETR